MFPVFLETGSNPELSPEDRGIGRPARIDFRDAFYLATAGGGIALDMPVGLIAPGYRFDAIAIKTGGEYGTLRISGNETPEGILQKIIYTSSRSDITHTWTDGILRRPGSR